MKQGSKWEVVIGLETHAQLSTVSKIFSGSATAFGAPPNAQASAVDIALPGVLPVLNRGAVERAIRFGLAVGATIAERSVFARKNYFYPDLPKAYQISQYEIPVVQGGSIRIASPTRGEIDVQLTRAHLEEDAGKSLHEDFHGMTGIDLNRAGTPLLEIVSEPDMRSAEEAVAYAKTLHALVRWIGICDGNMQEGSFRCDANVSVRPTGDLKLGTRCEIKNLNSFRFMHEAIEFEVRRQIELIEDGGTVVQETRLYDSERHETRSMRSKEDAQDYRYFPDPDLPPLVIEEKWVERVRAGATDTPWQRRKHYTEALSLGDSDAEGLTTSRDKADYFDRLRSQLASLLSVPSLSPELVKTSANWILGPVAAKLNEDGLEFAQCSLAPDQLAMLVKEVELGSILYRRARDEAFPELWRRTKQPAAMGMASYLQPGAIPPSAPGVLEVIQSLGLREIADASDTERAIDQVLAANASTVADYRSGKERAFNALVGKVMAATKGKANPSQVNELLKAKLS